MPDGCRDLIVKQSARAAPVWFFTDVASTSKQVRGARLDHYNGFRLMPGVQIDQAGLIASLDGELTDAAIKERLDKAEYL